MKSLKFLSIFLILVSLIACHLSHPSSVLAASCYDDCLAEGNTPIECKAACGSWVDEVSPQKLEQEIKLGKLSKETSTVHTLNVLTAAGVRMIVGSIATEAGTRGVSYRPGGAIGGVTNLIAAMYANPPASGVEYLADLGRNLGIVSPAYAQAGVGFGGLSPILPIWKAFRNIAYLFFIIIFIATGFAIMFRMKISPQAVMTIQSAIPRVVIALILVTFSYAIAGFLIDLIYVMIAIVTVVFETTGFLEGGASKAQEIYFGASPLTLVGEFGTRGWPAIQRIVELLNPAAYLPDAVGKIIDWLGKIPGLAMFKLPSDLATLILCIALLFVFFKLFFALLFAYIKILIGIIFGPLQLIMGVLPGSNSLGGWLKGLLSNLLVFPATIAMFLLADVILVATEKSGKLWAPPFLHAGDIAIQGEFIGGLIAYGILLMTPKVVEMVNQALQVKPSPVGAGMIAPISMAGGLISQPVTQPLRAAREGILKGIETKIARKAGVPTEVTAHTAE